MSFFIRLSATLALASVIVSSANGSAILDAPSAVEARDPTFDWGNNWSNNWNNHWADKLKKWKNFKNNGGGSTCKNNEFKFHRGKADCCLPRGGIPRPPAPPPGRKCPMKGYYWSKDNDCCVPYEPPKDDEPDEPECPSKCRWNRNNQFCEDDPEPPSPQPSGHPKGGHGKGGHGKGGHGKGGHDKDDHDKGSRGNHGHGHGRDRRAHLSRSESPCPSGLSACPIPGLNGGEYECLDVANELESCGGCASVGQGQDCTAIPGAWNVGCENGTCAVYSCETGYSLAADKKSCIAL